MYFLLCYDINFYLFEGMSQQLNLNSGYYANNGKGRSHPYHCTPLYRQYSDAMMSTPSTGQKTNLFSRAARHIRHALPGQERTDRSSWWPMDGRRTDVFDRASSDMRHALLPSSETWRMTTSQESETHRVRRGPPKRCKVCSFHQSPPHDSSPVFHHHFSGKT